MNSFKLKQSDWLIGKGSVPPESEPILFITYLNDTALTSIKFTDHTKLVEKGYVMDRIVSHS